MAFFNLKVEELLLKIGAAVIVLLIGFLVARILGKLTRKVLHELER